MVLVRDSGFGIRDSGLYGLLVFYFKSIYDTLYSHFVYCKIKS